MHNLLVMIVVTIIIYYIFLLAYLCWFSLDFLFFLMLLFLLTYLFYIFEDRYIFAFIALLLNIYHANCYGLYAHLVHTRKFSRKIRWDYFGVVQSFGFFIFGSLAGFAFDIDFLLFFYYYYLQIIYFIFFIIYIPITIYQLLRVITLYFFLYNYLYWQYFIFIIYKLVCFFLNFFYY